MIGFFDQIQIVGRIRFDGPMTIAQYMQELLTHPREGYYMHRLVISIANQEYLVKKHYSLGI
jgi:SAM-dependent MidA family methyltransferase